MSPKPIKIPHVQPGVTTDCLVSCHLEAVLSVDGHGQLVIPKEIRARAHIADEDKLALISWEREGTICCLSLVKTEAMSPDVSATLRQLMK
jgi:antitoxin PrlF